MTDVHCHVSCGDQSIRELLIGRDFIGVHPWDAASVSDADLDELEARLAVDSRLGVGEIGLDRLREREISLRMRSVFERQLATAFRLRRPIVLHGAKCWGKVVEAVRGNPGVPLLFHGFSRSDGLVPEIVRLNGYVSVGPAVLNDHAVNYRALVKKIPAERLLLETDRTSASPAGLSVRDVLLKVAEIRGIAPDALEALTDANADKFISSETVAS